MKSSIEQHMSYVGLNQAEIAALREAKPIIEAHADEFVQRFYAHLKAFEETKAFLAQEAIVQRLLVAQREYLLHIFDGKFDAHYFQNRRTIGMTHFRIGLDFKWYVGAYALYLDFFIPLLTRFYSDDPALLALIQSAFRKAMLLDMSIVLDAYHECDRAALESSRSQITHQEKLATIGLLASGLAHEIGNPLASIQAVCDNQLRRHPDTSTAEKFERIRGQVLRIVDIVRKLVDYSRPAPDSWRPTNFNEEIEAALAIARLSRSAKSIRVSLQLDPNLPPVEAIEGQLSQVFLNLILNAIDAMREHAGELTIVSRRSGSNVQVEVKDNGSGISEKNLARIFDPFFTTKDVGKGTGLGLHVSLGIVERHCGRIVANSTVGVGSEFMVEVPVKQTVRERTKL
ncbi:MAG TPA: protoglobin domain-containing protein [Planctomycetota bacterium]|nr:protoglobin domain-containing protein [Planctomycetota bacterium]